MRRMNRDAVTHVAQILLLGAGLSVIACSPATPATPVQSQAAGVVQSAATPVVATVQARATNVAPTVQAAAANVAANVPPAAQAAATSVAPTVAALATQAVGTLQPAVATTVAASQVKISQATIADGDTTITLSNSGSSAIDLAGWILGLGPFLIVLPAGTI